MIFGFLIYLLDVAPMEFCQFHTVRRPGCAVCGLGWKSGWFLYKKSTVPCVAASFPVHYVYEVAVCGMSFDAAYLLLVM